MNEKKFLQQMYTKLENQLEQEVKLADDSIEISEGDKVIFRVDSKGDMLYSADKQFSNIVNKLHGKIENDVRNTKEFLKVMDNSPELTAVDLNAPYKKLLEYNDVVLAGTEHSDGSFEFVTWDCKNNSLDHGHYYEDQERAKEDFVKRPELLRENQILSADERFELYRCVEDTLSAGFELSSDVENILADVKEKLKDSIPDFDERLTTLDKRDRQQEQKMQRKGELNVYR